MIKRAVLGLICLSLIEACATEVFIQSEYSSTSSSSSVSSSSSSGAGGMDITSSVSSSSVSSSSGTGGSSSSSSSSGGDGFTFYYCLGMNSTDIDNPGDVTCECLGKSKDDLILRTNCSPIINIYDVPNPGDPMKCECRESGIQVGTCFDVAPQLDQPSTLECGFYTGCCGMVFGLN